MKPFAWKSIRWKRIALVLFPIAILLTAPIWYRLVNPTAYADTRCVIQQLDGSLIKGVGQSQCTNTGKPTLILGTQQNE